MTGQTETSDRATTFAAAAYMDAHDKAMRERDEALRKLRAEASRDRLLGSPAFWKPAGRLYAKCIDEIVLAKLDSLLEARKINDMSVSDRDADDMIEKAMGHKDWLLQDVRDRVPDVDRGLWTKEQFAGWVLGNCEVSRATVFARVERSRLTPRKDMRVTTINQHGHNLRVNVNSIDNSTNTVEVIEDQIFVQMREDFTAKVAGPELATILEKLTALEEARETPLFGRRFAELMTVAANFATILPILTPYLHPLAAMVQKWSG
jgi:hypothetical protein